MKVKDLIERLNALDPEAIAVVRSQPDFRGDTEWEPVEGLIVSTVEISELVVGSEGLPVSSLRWVRKEYPAVKLAEW